MTFYSSERRAHKLKNKNSNLFRNTPSNKQKLRQEREKRISPSLDDEEVMHQIIETLSEKLDDFHHVMNQTSSQINQSPSPIFNTPNETRIQLLDSELETELEEELGLDDLSEEDRVISGSNNSAKNAVSAGSIIAHQTSFNYAPSETTTYRYGFTNSEFFAFIANLDPVEYVIVIAIITIIIAVQLNIFEKQVISGALVDIGVSLGNMVEQELFQSARQNEINNRERNQAEQTDFDTLYEDINRLQAQINALKEQLGIQ